MNAHRNGPCRRQKTQRIRQSGARSRRPPRSARWPKRRRVAARPRKLRPRRKKLAAAADPTRRVTATGKSKELLAIFEQLRASAFLESVPI
jgi:hypothetical protein